MSLLVLGINHNTATVAVREKVAFAPELMQEALQQACNVAGLSETVILSTCNRTELYGVPAGMPVEEVEKRLLDWLCTYHRITPSELQPTVYWQKDADAVRHLMRVASGLDSMVLGEPQILGQMKSAFEVAQQSATVGSQLYRVFEDVFSVAKQVRTETAIGESPVSVAFAAVTLAHQIFSDLRQARALMIGAGRTIELVIQHLKEAGVVDIVVANRTLTNAQELKRKYGVREVLLSDIPQELEHTDIVVSSTASQLPILGKGTVERALRARRHKPIFMVDLAVPRDIEPEAGELDDVYLYSVDDLKEVIDSNLRNRQEAAHEAEGIIATGVENYLRKQRGLGIVSTLRNFRDKAEQIRDSELDKAIRALEKGEDPQKVVRELARLLTNKLIHAPSVQMKKASADGHPGLIELAQQLFELDAGNDPVAADSQGQEAELQQKEAGQQS